MSLSDGQDSSNDQQHHDEHHHHHRQLQQQAHELHQAQLQQQQVKPEPQLISATTTTTTPTSTSINSSSSGGAAATDTKTANSTSANNNNNTSSIAASDLDQSSQPGGSLNKPKRNPFCSRCRNHGKSAQVKGHKRHCEYRDCQCQGCRLVECRQIVSAAQIKRRRYQKQDEECGRRIEVSPPVLTREPNSDPATLIAKTLMGAASVKQVQAQVSAAVSGTQAGSCAGGSSREMRAGLLGGGGGGPGGVSPAPPSYSSQMAAMAALHPSMGASSAAAAAVQAANGGSAAGQLLGGPLPDGHSPPMPGTTNPSAAASAAAAAAAAAHLQALGCGAGPGTSPAVAAAALSNVLQLFHFPLGAAGPLPAPPHGHAQSPLLIGVPQGSPPAPGAAGLPHQLPLQVTALHHPVGAGPGQGLHGAHTQHPLHHQLHQLHQQHQQQQHHSTSNQQQDANRLTPGSHGARHLQQQQQQQSAQLAQRPLAFGGQAAAARHPGLREQINLVDEIHHTFGPLAIYAWLRTEHFDLKKVRDLIEFSRGPFDELLQVTGHSPIDLTSPIVD